MLKLMPLSNEFLNEQLYTVGQVTVDSSFHTQSADEGFFRFFGNDVIYSIKRTIDENDFRRLEKCLLSVKQGETLRTAIRMKGVSNELRWMLASIRMNVRPDHEPMYIITLSDIFSLEALAYSREYRNSEYRHILSLSNDLAFEYSFETKFLRVYMFDCYREIVLINCELGEWKHTAIDSGYIPQRCIQTFEKLCSDIENGVYRFEHELESSLLTYGKTREISLFRGITRYDDPEHKKVTGIISVISSRQKTKGISFAAASNRDTLSGLLNRQTVAEFAQEILNSKPEHNVNFILMEIDNFSQISNNFGHLFGDEIIYTIAQIIKTEIGKRGFAGRTGSGGFFIVVENTLDETDLRGILRAIRTKTEWAFADRFKNFRLTCSMGVSTYPVDSSNYNELFMQADKALYIAKEKGQNRYVIYDVEKHGAVETDIKNKIAYLGNKKSSSEKMIFLSELSERLVMGDIPDISIFLEQIRSIYGIDDILIFAGSEMNLLLSCGSCTAKDANYIFQNSYTDRFSGSDIFVIDNVNELEGRDDNAFEILSSQHIGGAVQYLITEDSIIKGLISFCYIDRFCKWSVTDTNSLTILGRIISSILKKQSYL